MNQGKQKQFSSTQKCHNGWWMDMNPGPLCFFTCTLPYLFWWQWKYGIFHNLSPVHTFLQMRMRCKFSCHKVGLCSTLAKHSQWKKRSCEVRFASHKAFAGSKNLDLGFLQEMSHLNFKNRSSDKEKIFHKSGDLSKQTSTSDYTYCYVVYKFLYHITDKIQYCLIIAHL